MAKCGKVSDAELRTTFNRYDTDGSGFIDQSELREAVVKSLQDQNPKDEDIDAVTKSVMEAVDTSGDGKISFEEFKKGFL